MKLGKVSPDGSLGDAAQQPTESHGRALYLTANLFAVAFGLAGLAQAWSTLMKFAHGPNWPANALWIVAALVWLITLVGYLTNVAAQRRWKTELSDPTFGPFTVLIVIVPMQLSVPLAGQARDAGEVVFWCAAALTVLVGAWISGGWIALDGDVRRWHPGYYLPVTAGGLIAGGASAALGFTTLSHVLFGLGVGSFLLIGSIVSQRLFVVPALPLALLPTIAIELAPPVVAADTWFAINGGKVDIAAAILGGFSVLMVLIQLRLIPMYRRAPFGPAYWAFSFPAAAAVTCGVHWLAAEHVRGGTALGYVIVGLLTAGFALLAARTVIGLLNGTFFLRVPVPDQAGPALTAQAAASAPNPLPPAAR
jgi:tellurite resistance protein